MMTGSDTLKLREFALRAIDEAFVDHLKTPLARLNSAEAFEARLRNAIDQHAVAFAAIKKVFSEGL